LSGKEVRIIRNTGRFLSPLMFNPRLTVIGRVPKLKFLDAAAVSGDEREEASKIMQNIARMPTEEYKKVSEGYVVSEDKGLDKIETNVVEGTCGWERKVILSRGRSIW
jgi:hypothetical protein